MRFLLRLLAWAWLFLAPWAAAQVPAVTINGTVTNVHGQALCAMVLINGQYMFSCDGQGRYELTVPLDASGQATVFSFVDGLAPYRQVISPQQATTTLDIRMLASVGVPNPVVTIASAVDIGGNQVKLSGQVRQPTGQPLCAMVLANGQYMFSCAGQGQFQLTVPRAADGSVTLFSFIDGFAPYRLTFTPTIVPPPAVPTAEGLWQGQTRDGRSITGLILYEQVFYFFYTPPGSPDLIAGVLQGRGSSQGSSFIAQDAREFSLEFGDVIDVGLTANFVPRQTLAGSVAALGESVDFTASYNADYELPASLPAVAGSYAALLASSGGAEFADLAVAPSGALAAQTGSGCQASGTVTPRNRGHVYDVTLQFSGPTCAFPGQLLTGLGYYDAGSQQFFVSAPNAGRTDAMLIVGAR